MKVLTALFIFLLLPAFAQAFEMSDVSILLPLPSAAQLIDLLGSQSGGARGTLLPLPVLVHVPGLTLDVDSHTTFTQLLKAVAIRIDPCFVEGMGPLACRHQIRFVWQPLTVAGSRVVAKDAALHSFYDLADSDWQTFLSSYAKLLADLPQTMPAGGILAINPAFAAGTEAWQKLKTLMLQFCGGETLSRVTTMGMGVDQGVTMWTFSGFDIAQGNQVQPTLTPMSIPLVSTTLQTVETPLLESTDFKMTISPIAAGAIGPAFYTDSTKLAQAFSEDEIRSFVGSEIEAENPQKTNTGTLDCAGCHTAMATIDWAFNTYQGWDWKSLKRAHAFQTTLPISAPYKSDRSSRLRAFGYFNDEPVIAPRTVNETANVLQALRSPPN